MILIKQLPPTVTNKIAAGEVIERPASIVKELLENALDAGGQNIELHITEGGREKILLIDDGCGMGPEDATVAFQRFSTSKITTFEDLDELSTFGFRGEALASIAAVSIVELKTKPLDRDEGTFVRIEGGTIRQTKEISWNRGTSITIGNIFFNTPARRKFLKNVLSETRQIYKVFRYYTLANPGLHFKLYNNGRTIWNVQTSDLSHRITDLFDANIRQNLIEIKGRNSQYSLSGYISVPEWTRSTRNDQYLFLNKRFIKNRSAEHAVYQGYGETLSQSRGHPFFVLMLTAPPDRFDINIHPTKLEARFQDERELHRLIANSVKEALGFPAKRAALPFSETFQSPVSDTTQRSMSFTHGESSDVTRESRGTDVKEVETAQRQIRKDVLYDVDEKDKKAIQIDREKIWQVHQCFIFSQVKNGLMIIDQHTAHERILYEKALRMLNEGEKPSQQLLFPQTIQLSKDEIVILSELIPHLMKLGFDIRVFGGDAAVIEAVPLNIKIGREQDCLQNILNEYQNDEYKDLDIHDRLARSFACRSAIMKGDRLTPEEMYRLIDDLFATDFPYYCPHGRPTVVDLGLKELNARFFR